MSQLEDFLIDLLGHSRNPRWRGHLSAATHQARVRSPRCGDIVTIEIQTDGDLIKDIRFLGRGCFVSQAVASIVCENVVGKLLSQVEAMPPAELLGFDPGILTRSRQQCALLGYQALMRAITPTRTDEPGDTLNRSKEMHSEQ